MALFVVLLQGLITEGVEFDTFPATPSLPAESGPCLVKLVGLPKAAGELNIIGKNGLMKSIRSPDGRETGDFVREMD